MNEKWKRWIYRFLLLALAVGTFYMVLEKKESIKPETSKEEVGDQGKLEDDKDIDESNIDDEKPEVNPRVPEEATDFSSLEIGKKLPDFTLKDLDGKDVNLRDLEGKIVLINFWATWCHWCDKEMADLDKLDKENEDLIVLGVNVDEPKSQVDKYVKEGGYNFKVVLDEGGVVAADYLVTGIPTSYFVNKDGIYVGKMPSYMTAEQMKEALEFTRDY